ncbi:MAG: long-chain-fatty-acid--CoA ligase [Nitrospinaceae bacterium]|nr:MAG: long-chain-fatty-acid--CoA ligase [Nitrospinaceae bacterium]
MALEFHNYLKKHAEKTPDHPAVIDGEDTLTYHELLEQVETFSNALSRLDLNPHSKLGIFCLNQKEYLIAFLGALHKGLPIVPFNFLLGPEDLVFIAKDAGIDVLIVDALFIKPETIPFFQMFPHKIVIGETDLAPLGAGVVPFTDFLHNGVGEKDLTRHKKDASIPDTIFYTSGTTGKPKGVMLNESQFNLNCDGILAHLDISGKDRAIIALPFFHSFGNIMALVLLRQGATLILLKQFAPKTILATITQHKVTLLPLVPTIYSFLIDIYARGGYDVSSLRVCFSGGASLPEALHQKVEEILAVSVLEGYGLTETSPVIAVNTSQRGGVPSSVGPVLPNIKLKIVDETGNAVKRGDVGEIWVQGETVMKGYWKNPKETEETLARDGWLKTGDLGHMDENNLLYISAGRKKDLIIRAGENVAPLAIENALMNHPAIAEVAAIGVPDDRLGEKVKVCAALREGAVSDEHDLKEFCRKKLPAFMIPDIIQFYESLPKNAAGKILKTQLRDS